MQSCETSVIKGQPEILHVYPGNIPELGSPEYMLPNSFICLALHHSFFYTVSRLLGAVRGWLVTYRLVTPTSSISEVLGQRTL